MQPRFAVSLCFAIAMAAAPGPASAVEIPAASATLVQVTGLQPDGSYMALLTLGVPPGWHTYWRTPGDTGMAPQISFAGSANLKSAEVMFPVPDRLAEDGSVSLVYRAPAQLPVRVVPQEAGRPGRLVAAIAYGVCKDICVPEQARAETAFSPSAPPPDAAALNSFIAATQSVPRPEAAADPVRVTRFSVQRDASGHRAAAIDIAVAEPGTSVTLLAEGPPEWALPQPSEQSPDSGPLLRRFILPLQNVPDDAPLQGKSLRFTLSSRFGNTEAVRTFP